MPNPNPGNGGLSALEIQTANTALINARDALTAAQRVFNDATTPDARIIAQQRVNAAQQEVERAATHAREAAATATQGPFNFVGNSNSNGFGFGFGNTRSRSVGGIRKKK